MAKTALIAVCSGGASSALALTALSGSPFGVLLLYVAPLPLLIMGLGRGENAFGVAAASGLAIVAIAGGLIAAGLYGSMHVIPAWIIVHQALSPRLASEDGRPPAGRILLSLTLLVAFVMTLTAWAGRGDQGLQAEVASQLAAFVEAAAPTLSEDQANLLVGELTPLFLGFSAVMWLLMLVVNGMLAQSLCIARGWSRCASPHWSALRLPAWIDWALAGCALVALLADGDIGYLARNVVIVLLTPYFFVGLAVVHGATARLRARGMVLGAFYASLFIFFFAAAALVAAIGVAEQWVGIRSRLQANDPERRNE